MRRARDPKNWRELRNNLPGLGGVAICVNGSHEKWRFARGVTFVVVINHLADAVPIGVRVKFRRLRERLGGREGEDPAPLGLAGSW